MCWMVGYKKNNTEFETVVENNYCTHNPLNLVQKLSIFHQFLLPSVKFYYFSSIVRRPLAQVSKRQINCKYLIYRSKYLISEWFYVIILKSFDGLISLYHTYINIPALLLKKHTTFANQGRDIDKSVIKGDILFSK
jgi:hypothetical protein